MSVHIFAITHHIGRPSRRVPSSVHRPHTHTEHPSFIPLDVGCLMISIRSVVGKLKRLRLIWDTRTRISGTIRRQHLFASTHIGLYTHTRSPLLNIKDGRLNRVCASSQRSNINMSEEDFARLANLMGVNVNWR